MNTVKSPKTVITTQRQHSRLGKRASAERANAAKSWTEFFQKALK